MSPFHSRRMKADRSARQIYRCAHDASAGENRYIAMAMTGLNDKAKVLRPVDEHAVSFGSFAEAKADAVRRAEDLREYFDSAGYEYRAHTESGDHHYEASFQYGPLSPDQTPRLRMIFHVYRCTVTHGRARLEEIDQHHPGICSISPVRDC